MLRKLADACKTHVLPGRALGTTFTRAFADASGTSTTKASRSMLDSTSVSSMGIGDESLGAASAAVMKQAKATPTPEEPAPPSVLQRLFGAIVDVGFVGAVGVAGFTGYVYYNYKDEELEKQFEEYTKNLDDRTLPEKAWALGIGAYLDYVGPLKQRVKAFTDPSLDKLLPDMHPDMKRMGLKTLVLDLEGLLVHKEWTREKGWQVYKRPGVQEFLHHVSHYYETVVFTDELHHYAEPVIFRLFGEKIPPAHRLYRPETQYHEGKHVRDLSKLNRDLSHVLFISANPDAYSFQPDNALKLKPWEHDFKDTTLLDLIPFLQMVAMAGVKDVRDVVRAYDGEEDVAAAFKRRMQQLEEQQHKPKKSFLFGAGKGGMAGAGK